MKLRHVVLGVFAAAAAAGGGVLMGQAVSDDVHASMAKAKRDAAEAKAQPTAYKYTGTHKK